MQTANIDVTKLEIYGGGEHWSRFYPVFEEFEFSHNSIESSYSAHIKHIKTNEELANLIKETIEVSDRYAAEEFEKYAATQDGGAMQFMNAFTKWTRKYFRDVVEDANKQLDESQKISIDDLGISRAAQLRLEQELSAKTSKAMQQW